MSEVISPGAEEADRLDRSRRVGWIDVDAVTRSRALVVGAGALGNEVVKNLVLSGFRRIVVIDMDRVAKSNLNRCLFFREGDAERAAPKAAVMAERAASLAPEVELEAISARVQDLGDAPFQECDIVFGCLDNILARLHINSHSYHRRRPLVDGGTMGTSGKVQVVLPPTTPCLQCGMNRTHFRVLEKRYSCTGSDTVFFEPKTAAEITTTSVIAAIQVREGIKVLSGQSHRCLHHLLHYNGFNNQVQELEVPFDPECPMHAQ